MTTRMRRSLWLLAVLAFVAAGGWWTLGGRFTRGAADPDSASVAPGYPTSLHQILASSPAQIGDCDIALLNLVCAEGLPGAEHLNPQECIATLDAVG